MKKITINSLLSGLILCSAVSCFKDKGNYNYKELNEITIKVASDTVLVKQFDTLKITPEVHQKLIQNNALKFSWYFLNPGALGVPRVDLADEKDLDIQFKAIPGQYNLYLKVTDTTTGISEYHAFHLTVTNNLSEGWLAIYDTENDSSDVAIILPEGKIFYNLFQKTNGLHLSGEARKVCILTPAYGGKQYIFCLSSNDIEYVNSLDFTRILDFNNSFYNPPAVADPQAIFPSPGYFIYDFLIKAGKVYSRAWAIPGSLPKYGLQVEGDYKAAPYIMGSPYLNFGPYPTVIYDEDHNRFLYVPLNQSAFTPFPHSDTAAFNVNDMGDKTLLFAYNSPTGQATAVFKNRTDNACFIYKLDFAGDDPALTPFKLIKNSPDLAKAKLFDISPLLPLIYYAYDNKIYKYDIEANSSSLLYTFPSGEDVTAIKILDPQMPMRYTLPDLGKRIVVATYDGSEGKAYEFEIAPTGAFQNNKFIHKYVGFGKISSFYYKIRL